MGIANGYKKLPSEILRIDDEYTAYCFDEACMLIKNRLDSGEEFAVVETKSYSNFSSLYNQIES